MLNIKEKQLLTVLMNSQNLEIHQKLQSDYMALDIFNLIGASLMKKQMLDNKIGIMQKIIIKNHLNNIKKKDNDSRILSGVSWAIQNNNNNNVQ